jgi:hypothetical protein
MPLIKPGERDDRDERDERDGREGRPAKLKAAKGGRSIAPICPECGRPNDDPGPRVKVKRFCSAECRSRWHGRQRQQAWHSYLQQLTRNEEER